MRKKKIVVVFGTRPEAIKLVPVIGAIERHPALEPVVCVTGQHRELLDQVLDTFGVRPDHDLKIMTPGQTLSETAARILHGLEGVLQRTEADFLLVHGDTSTCFASSLASFYRGVPVGHVEAGLRTWDLQAPFPEEAHRSMVARLARLHFAPTDHARRNLVKEGIDPSIIHVTGNTVVDALTMARDALGVFPPQRLSELLGEDLCRRLGGSRSPVVLITGHRRENLGDRLETVSNAIHELAIRHRDWSFVYLLHPNPAARLSPVSILGAQKNVFLIEPLEYLPFVWLMMRSNVILTDSGGLQEEASELGKPILVMRDVTERPEAVDAGTARLVGTNGAGIVESVERALLDPAARSNGKAHQLYGDGKAAERIADLLWSALTPARAPLMTAPNRRVGALAPQRARAPRSRVAVPGMLGR